DDGFKTLPESWAGQILIHDLHLGVLTDARLAHGRDFDQRLPQRDRNWDGATRVSHPNAFDMIERVHAPSQCVGDDQCDVGFGLSLVLAKLGEPAVGPVLGPLRLPQDRAAMLIERANYTLQYITTELTFGHRLNKIARKFRAQRGLERELLN